MSHLEIAQQLDQLLLDNRSFWRSPAYQLKPPCWVAERSALTNTLLALDDTTVAQLQADDHALLTALQQTLPSAKSILCVLQQLPNYENHIHQEPPSSIPGRKWQQVLSFCQHLPSASGPFVEWCCGKSYLGRELRHRFNVPVLSLDIDDALLRSASLDINDEQHQLRQCDVLSDDVLPLLNHQHRLVALHACGGLHQRLLQCAVEKACAEIALSPCCYHRFITDYQPLSQYFQAAEFQLTKADLRTAVRQTTTARKGQTLARRHHQAKQFAVRHFLQDAGLNGDMTLPSLSKISDSTTFRQYARDVLRHKGIAMAPPNAEEPWMQRGWQSLLRAERFELLRMAFRRIIELRCVIDSVMFLEEHHYRCQLKQFCPPTMTPRNLMIVAQR